MKKLILIILIFTGVRIFGQAASSDFYTGNLRADFNFYSTPLTNQINILQEEKEKSLILAGLFSAVIPGAGEIYSESYWKAGIFLVLEGLGWYFNISYMKKGDDQTEFFQNYANENWDVTRYAAWLNTYKQGNINIDPNTSKPPWERVSWDEIHAVEEKIPEFSHKLAPYNEQQYYEMIGKYRQFVSGWKEYKGGSDYYNNVPDQMNYYSGLRGKANDYYNIAYKAVTVLIINHLLSVADAIWTANTFNSNLKTNVSLEKRNIGYFSEYFPQVNFRYSF